MPKTLAIYTRIHELRQRYYQISTGKEALLSLISAAEVAEQVYNSNAIENSTLSLEETDKILHEIDLDRYISEREIFEAKNLARVVEYIQTKAPQQELTIDLILSLHRMLLSNIRDKVAGRFRRATEYVHVGSYIAVDPEKVRPEMMRLLATYQGAPNDSIIKRIAVAHLTFEHIHPFVDGNGRIGRVINNYLLVREGYVPINIKHIDKQKYYDAFREFDLQGKSAIMEEIVGKALTNSYHKRLAYLEGKKIIPLSEYAKVTKQSHSNLLNKANRQTIDAFLEKGVWKIGA
ncbi:MAG: cell filamentation protein Fic [Candidatus Pacebacteria bacterium CG10_big_fil_rev_8_21_14_0_10_44_54]|nr:Fic family protein [bacterium]PIR60304.1 MAG: cell filamentation protein Fic [Candidatus Pacebacteria bacterium CG10_big_fil_rev_8_21_14_0_10_44_54]